MNNCAVDSISPRLLPYLVLVCRFYSELEPRCETNLSLGLSTGLYSNQAV